MEKVRLFGRYADLTRPPVPGVCGPVVHVIRPKMAWQILVGEPIPDWLDGRLFPDGAYPHFTVVSASGSSAGSAEYGDWLVAEEGPNVDGDWSIEAVSPDDFANQFFEIGELS